MMRIVPAVKIDSDWGQYIVLSDFAEETEIDGVQFAGMPESCQNHVLASDGSYETGFPVEEVGGETITVRRFPLPKLTSFQLPAVRYIPRSHRTQAPPEAAQGRREPGASPKRDRDP